MTTLEFDTAYYSFGGEVEASTTPTICRLPDLPRHQLSTIAQADAYKTAALLKDPVDYVFLANAFHGVPDRARLAQAVHDVLKPGGLFGIVNWYARPREKTPVLGEPRGPATELRMTLEQTVASVEFSGLKFSKHVDVSPYHYGAVFERLR